MVEFVSRYRQNISNYIKKKEVVMKQCYNEECLLLLNSYLHIYIYTYICKNFIFHVLKVQESVDT